MNHYPAWKYGLLALILLFGVLYAAPNLFGESLAIQILPMMGRTITSDVEIQIKEALQEAKIPYQSISKKGIFLIRFSELAFQIKAQEVIQEKLGDHYTVTLSLAPMTPTWLEALGAKPMKLGLDLRGGVHFLMEVDIHSAMLRRIEALMGEMRAQLRESKIRYRQMTQSGEKGCVITFDDEATLEKASKGLKLQHPELDITSIQTTSKPQLLCQLSLNALQEIRNYTMEQTLTILRNRVNELGVAEAVVQRQGLDKIVIELPGIQDTARAKDILGKTATLEFHLYAKEEAMKVAPGEIAPPGTKWFYDQDRTPYLLKKRVILTGDSITGAMLGTDERSGRPAVKIRVGGGGLALFKKETLENIGNLLGAVYIEKKIEDGQAHTFESLIEIARIDSALGSQFQITGLSLADAKNVVLLLRSGALPAAVSIVEERTIGPSLGQENIRLGVISIEVGLSLVLLAMLLYYSVFGFIADLALLINVVLLVAILSLIDATLTLPGMAGILLTVGMAVDANVLIFERIREELRQGMSPHTAIRSGFDRALSTIIDANLTTLIVGAILFVVGTGPVKGFAITLCIGILTSMITAITGTRAMVNMVYGGRVIKRLRVGI